MIARLISLGSLTIAGLFGYLPYYLEAYLLYIIAAPLAIIFILIAILAWWSTT